MALDKSFNPSVKFSYVDKKENKTSIFWILGRLNDLIYEKCLARYLAPSNGSVHFSWIFKLLVIELLFDQCLPETAHHIASRPHHKATLMCFPVSPITGSHLLRWALRSKPHGHTSDSEPGAGIAHALSLCLFLPRRWGSHTGMLSGLQTQSHFLYTGTTFQHCWHTSFLNWGTIPQWLGKCPWKRAAVTLS